VTVLELADERLLAIYAPPTAPGTGEPQCLTASPTPPRPVGS
jgi:hypothetical protein